MNQASAKRRNALLAGAAGVALLIGGSTYALWSATGSLTGGSITAGDLKLDTSVAPAAYDVSADRSDTTIADVTVGTSPAIPLLFGAGQVAAYNSGLTDAALGNYGIKARTDTVDTTKQFLQGHSVDTTTWLIVPGDTAAMVTPMTVTLKGDNLVATLDLDVTSLAPGTTGLNNSEMTYSAALFDAAGKQIGSMQAIPAVTQTLTPTIVPIALLQAIGTGQTAGVDDQYGLTGSPITVPVVDGTATLTLVVFAHFTDTGAGQLESNATKVDNLTGLKVNLTQVRDLTDNFGNPTPFPA